MQSLLRSTPVAAPLETRAQNGINGSDAESYAMARIVLACRGEGHWGSREEDNSKIDMIFSCEHPWHAAERMLVLAQVKSGDSYGESLKTGFRLKASAKKNAIRTSHAVCVLWVDRTGNRVYWAYVHPSVKPGQQDYGAYHEVSPATRFDLARCMSVKPPGNTGGRGIIIRRQSGPVEECRKSVLSTYRKNKRILCPVLGEVELTRLGWRHMFRTGRVLQNKASSLDLIPYLGVLLKQWPTEHAITDHRESTCNGYRYRVCEHLLKYDDITLREKTGFHKRVVAHIRIVEEIRYPVNWESNVMLSQIVARRLALKSAYYKA